MSFLDALVVFITQLAFPAGDFRKAIEFIGDFATFLALAGAAIFATSYRVFFNWRLTPAGRALAQFTLALTAVLGLVLLARLFGQDYAFRFPLRAAVYIWCAYSMFQLVHALWANWRRGEPRLLDIETKDRPKKEKTP